MSHELRTPLTAVIGFSEVLLDRLFGELNEKQERYLEDIRRSGRHLLELLNDILDLSKVEAGKMELELADTPVSAALEQSVAMVGERASQHGLALEVRVDPDVADVVADPLRLKQVALNLLSNAVKFTPPGGKVKVRARRVGDEVHVTVEDTGIGISAGGSGADFRVVRAGTQWPLRRLRGDRAGADALEANRGTTRRPPLGREPAR